MNHNFAVAAFGVFFGSWLYVVAPRGLGYVLTSLSVKLLLAVALAWMVGRLRGGSPVGREGTPEVSAEP